MAKKKKNQKAKASTDESPGSSLRSRTSSRQSRSEGEEKTTPSKPKSNTTPAHPGQSRGPKGAVTSNGKVTGEAAPKEQLKPHPYLLAIILKSLGWLLVFMFFLVPLIVKLNPWIMTEVAFLYRIRWPPFLDLSKPKEIGMNCTRNFYIDSQRDSDVRIGAWHVLPTAFSSCDSATEEFFMSSLSQGMPIILYLHGNAGTRAGRHRMMLYRVLAKSGYHVISIDYRGFADSTGYPSEDGTVDDAMSAFYWIKKHSSTVSVYVWGHSLGTGIGTKTAKKLCERGDCPTGLILEAPFNNMVDAALNHPLSTPFYYMPYFSWVFLEGIHANNIFFDSEVNIADVTCPILIMHAKDDGMVPYDLGYKLYKAAKRSRSDHKDMVTFVSFESVHGYGHKHIHKAPELPKVLWNFTHANFVEEVPPEKMQPPKQEQEHEE